MRHLILFRHAKTEPYSETGGDETRRLTERGRSDAFMMAGEVLRYAPRPDCVLVSTARRTRETWSEVSKVITDVKARYSEGLYLASPEEIADQIAAQPDCDTLMVIGHNEGLHDFALQLAEIGGTRNQPALSEMRARFPTAAFAVFTAKDDAPFSRYNFELTEFFTPKALRPVE